jgi:hypothetical protein
MRLITILASRSIDEPEVARDDFNEVLAHAASLSTVPASLGRVVGSSWGP